MKLSSYCFVTAFTVVYVAMIISKALNPPTKSGQEDMAYYVKAIDEALLTQFVDKTVDLKDRDAWHKPELFAEIEALCGEWKPLAGRWKAHKISDSISTLCGLHEMRLAQQQAKLNQ